MRLSRVAQIRLNKQKRVVEFLSFMRRYARNFRLTNPYTKKYTLNVRILFYS